MPAVLPVSAADDTTGRPLDLGESSARGEATFTSEQAANRTQETPHAMIDLHHWPTPNGWKISVMLEACGLADRVVPVNIGRCERFKPDFPAISPNGRLGRSGDCVAGAPAAPADARTGVTEAALNRSAS